MKFLEVTTRPELDITNHRLHVDNACTSYSVEKIHIVGHRDSYTNHENFWIYNAEINWKSIFILYFHQFNPTIKLQFVIIINISDSVEENINFCDDIYLRYKEWEKYKDEQFISSYIGNNSENWKEIC